MPTSVHGSDRSRPAGRGASAGRTRGFTLIELIVVVALIALATGVAALTLRDGSVDRLEREGIRLAALLEGARVEARAAALPVQWLPTPGERDQAFRFVGLPASRPLPAHWLDDGVVAQFDPPRTALTLGPEPLIGAQRVVLARDGARVEVITDGLRPFSARVLAVP